MSSVQFQDASHLKRPGFVIFWELRSTMASATEAVPGNTLASHGPAERKGLCGRGAGDKGTPCRRTGHCGEISGQERTGDPPPHGAAGRRESARHPKPCRLLGGLWRAAQTAMSYHLAEGVRWGRTVHKALTNNGSDYVPDIQKKMKKSTSGYQTSLLPMRKMPYYDWSFY